MSLLKPLHTLAIGLWFGAGVFFTIQGVVMARTFAELSEKQPSERPRWFPPDPLYEKPALTEKALPAPLPNPVRREQGSRVFGEAVAPLFPIYFALQAGCAAVALLTALAFLRPQPGWLGKGRLLIVLLAAVGVGVGWWMERVVHQLRGPRNYATNVYVAILAAPPRTMPEEVEAEFHKARADFGRWHGYSLLANFATLLLVTLATGLAGFLPPTPRQENSLPSSPS